jgi:hypothetical protein
MKNLSLDEKVYISFAYKKQWKMKLLLTPAWREYRAHFPQSAEDI